MSIVCQRGLFVGVDRHAKLPRAYWLTNASADATALRDYFRRAQPEGPEDRWRAVVGGTRRSSPKQIDILTALDGFAQDVPVGESGLFYFSGHATLSNNGLVLKCFDSHDVFPEDTGLPFARALEILKAQSAHDKRFLVVLDCCRSGVKEAATDNLPPNVCVLYACEHESEAYETSNGGILTRSIIESLEAIAFETGSKNCSVRTLSNRLGRQLFVWRPLSALAFELYGNWAAHIYLPIATNPEQSPDDQRVGPNSVLKYWLGQKHEFESAVNQLARAVFDWYGIPYDSPPGRRFVREHFEFSEPLSVHDVPDGSEVADLVRNGVTVDEGSSEVEIASSGSETQNFFFQIRIPGGCSRWTSADFLVHLLNAPVTDPQALILTWRGKVDFSIFKQFRHAVNGEWFGAASPTGLSLQWTNELDISKYRGLASVLPLESGETSVVVTCETTDPREMSLAYLLPGLRGIYDLFRSVTI